MSGDDLEMRKRGVYGKFTVERTDGKSAPGQKHFDCEYFVLDATHDPHAKAALLAYADSCEPKYPKLAEDARRMASGERVLSRLEAQQPIGEQCNCAGCAPANWPETNGWKCGKWTGEQPTPPECHVRKALERIAGEPRIVSTEGNTKLQQIAAAALSTPCSPCQTNFQGLWSQVLQCFQDTRPSVGDAYRLKMLLVEHEKEQG